MRQNYCFRAKTVEEGKAELNKELVLGEVTQDLQS